MVTNFENKDGSIDFGFAWAIVTDSPTFKGQTFGNEKGETLEQFEERLSDEVYEATGVRPVNDDELRPCA